MLRRSGPIKSRARREWEAQRAARVEREPKPLHRLERPGVYTGGTTGVAVEKERPIQHKGYMQAVRSLGYCMRCKRWCIPQFCHRDQTKGMGIKTDCREGWPGCAECHYLVGTSGYYPKEDRRALELDLGWRTRQAVNAAGLWPADLEKWNEK